MWKIFGNPSKINSKSIQNQSKTVQNRDKCVLGAISAPNRAQVGSRTLRPTRSTSPFEPFWPKMKLQGSIFGPLENRKSVQKRIFEDRLALGPSKNGFWKGVRKKHENLMKNRCENERFLMARNHVWRYTLRLFHTFAIFEKNRKINAKREAKSHCRRRASPPHPLDTSRVKQSD